MKNKRKETTYKDEIVFNAKEIEKRDSEVIEEWKQIVIDNVEYDYEISNKGRVRNMSSGLILKQDKRPNGYKSVRLHGKLMSVHRLIAINFIKVPKKYTKKGYTYKDLVVNHIDHYKWHNIIYNLEWMTAKENTHDAIKYHLMDCNYGENSHFSKMSNETAHKCCKMLDKGYSSDYISKKLGISKKSVIHIKAGECWKNISKNYKFNIDTKHKPFKVSDDDVHKICKLLETRKYSDYEIANKVKVVDRRYVNRIRNRQTRKYICSMYSF